MRSSYGCSDTLSPIVHVLTLCKRFLPRRRCLVKQQCNAPGCMRPARTKGYCPKHYQQIRSHGRLTPEREHRRNGEDCLVAGCESQPVAKGYCYRHYQQIRRHGRLTPERERVYGRTGCSVEGCTEKHFARGYCKRHYQSQYLATQRKRKVQVA